ncbi:DUF1622 domain-containing protein [Thiocapsa bogorovii]|uniref:DUF1622 domain-containing protein n=1 Tax=Thiocapsa bogorovii TaxID=521689 RepID=UPI001E51D480|nr:DUF1622 domain-containing protein [Thiocapsa bogorovii]UHD15878.1 DUF1622 domain-containing protein [Thiocapsa bogorovii]
MSEGLEGLPEAVPGIWLPDPAALGVEEWVLTGVLWLKLGVEAMGALIIGIGVLVATYQFIGALLSSGIKDYNPIRLTLARYLALALEFQVGADILSTAVAPSWDQIGKLGAIVVIRTALNYFLMREMQEEHRGR